MRSSPIIASGAVVCMFALLLPAQLPRTSASIADEACLTLADSDAPEDIPTDQLERCSTLYPTDVDLIALVGARAEAARQRDAAEAAYRRALALEPGFADLRLRLARLLLARGAAAEAAREARIALETQPNRQALTDLIREADARAAAR